MKQQITVRERNNWEAETFNYVLYVSPEEKSEIIEKCIKHGKGSLSVSETNYTDDEIHKLNLSSSNSYMDFIAPYKLKDQAIDNWKEHGGCFYKGVGLTKLEALEKKEADHITLNENT